MQGIIEKIESKTGRESGNPFEIITIKGVEYSYFDDLDTFHEGDTVEYEIKEKGKYKNLINVQLVKPTNIPKKPHSSTSDEIRRMNAATTAKDIEVYNASFEKRKVLLENVLGIAKIISQFVMGQESQGNPEEKLEQDDGLLQELTLLCKSEGIRVDTFNDYCQDQYMTKLLLMRTETIRTMMDQWDTTVGKLKTWKTKQQED